MPFLLEIAPSSVTLSSGTLKGCLPLAPPLGAWNHGAGKVNSKKTILRHKIMTHQPTICYHCYIKIISFKINRPISGTMRYKSHTAAKPARSQAAANLNLTGP